jgi:hypothetical protein
MCTSRPIRLAGCERGFTAFQLHIHFLHLIYSTKACSLISILRAKTYYKIVKFSKVSEKNFYNFEKFRIIFIGSTNTTPELISHKNSATSNSLFLKN